ncbi:MAG: hypothetical protein R2809_13955 [Flavobacteriales bacterium]
MAPTLDMDITALLNYDSAAAAENDGAYYYPGCTDAGAVNYDAAAGCDGSCCSVHMLLST